MSNTSTILSTHLKRYQIIERLGAGGMATVYKARDTNLQRDVAIKVLHEHLVYDPTFKERFEREARLVASFNHPNIVQVYDFDVIEVDDTKLYYMVMPFLKGRTLADVIGEYRQREETIPHQRIKEIVQDLASALDYAHAHEMVHRDVKPANIVFDENDRAILTDFGIARLAQSGLTKEDAIIGTPAYMSPEQATGQPTDYRSDLYALGVIIYEMLTGRTPFEDENTVSLLLKHAHEQPPPVSTFLHVENPALDIVLANALDKNPEQRYQNATAFLADLKLAVEAESDTQRLEPGTMPERLEKASSIGTELFYADKAKPNLFTSTIHTMIIKPARQNPLGLVALAIALFALLIVARLAQSPSALTSPNDSTDNGADSMVGGAMYFSTSFDDDDDLNAYWQTSSEAVESVIEDGEYHISNTQAGRAITITIEPQTFMFEDVHITLKGYLSPESASEYSAYGIVFNYHDDQNLNVFAIDGLSHFSIWKLENNVWCELRFSCEGQDYDAVWTQNDAISGIGENNTLTINTYQGLITAYVNETQVLMLEDSTFTSGGAGIYLATTQLGAAETVIDSYEVAAAMSTTGSMTGDN